MILSHHQTVVILLFMFFNPAFGYKKSEMVVIFSKPV